MRHQKLLQFPMHLSFRVGQLFKGNQGLGAILQTHVSKRLHLIFLSLWKQSKHEGRFRGRFHELQFFRLVGLCFGTWF